MNARIARAISSREEFSEIAIVPTLLISLTGLFGSSIAIGGSANGGDFCVRGMFVLVDEAGGAIRAILVSVPSSLGEYREDFSGDLVSLEVISSEVARFLVGVSSSVSATYTPVDIIIAKAAHQP